jgi:hypothetical protein
LGKVPAFKYLPFSRISLAVKVLQELGLKQVGLYTLYRIGLLTGHYRRAIKSQPVANHQVYVLQSSLISLPDKANLSAMLGADGLEALLVEANEIVNGKIRLFGGQSVPLTLTVNDSLRYWTEYEKGTGEKVHEINDIKFVWEPARFGWACTLARAYYLSGDEQYGETFWRYVETFLDTNPPYQGPHWASAQEVALRLVALVFAAQVLAGSLSSTPERMARLGISVANHAARIPPTLIYARAQNNNHLISEALGLYTAAAAIPNHPEASGWQKLGWDWLNHAFQSQIAEDGTYTQHSTNYHRLMLQAALWASTVQCNAFPDQPFPETTRQRLAAATRWLLAMLDPSSGRFPNLGHNDGAYILPLSICPFYDYRPVLQAAGQAFLGEQVLPPGKWDEMTLWYGGWRQRTKGSGTDTEKRDVVVYHLPSCPCILRKGDAWGYLRTARFTDRPGHADQLHLDLWWRGLNIAQDAGTYSYNAPPPWGNALMHTAVHNTVMIDGLEQMRRAGRFLYLDRAQGEITAEEYDPCGVLEGVTARHNGYRQLGIIHQRTVMARDEGQWIILDEITGKPSESEHTARLQWLLPDWAYVLQTQKTGIQSPEYEIHLLSPAGRITLKINIKFPSQGTEKSSTGNICWSLIRCGERIIGNGSTHNNWGWVSPTYGIKTPALSLIIEVKSKLPLGFMTEWILPV